MKNFNFKQLVKYTSISIILMCLTLTSFTQDSKQQKEYYADQASSIVDGAEFVKTSPFALIPTRVMFTEKNQLEFSSFFQWLRTEYEISADYTFINTAEIKDDLGNVHYRYRLNYRDADVDLNWLVVHANSDIVYSFNGYIQFIPNISTEPAIMEENALQAAMNNIGANTYLWEKPEEEQLLKIRKKDNAATYFPKGKLVLVENANSMTGQFRLAWLFEIRTDEVDLDQEIFIDATTGEKIKSNPLSYQCDVGTVSTTWNGTQNINTDQNGDGDYILLDDCGGAEIHTTTTSGSDYVNSDNSWTAAGETGPGTTHYHGRVTMDYFSAIHSRNSYDGSGGDLEIRHINDANAYWSGGGLMRIGRNATDANYYNTLDVVAHEFTHGVIDNTADLVYQGEPGALNESFSDIFGETCEVWHEGTSSNEWDWLHREDYFNGNNRSFINPNDKSDPDTYNGDFWANTCNGCGDAGGVHTNSGVQNYWFYLLSVGGSGTNDINDDFNVSGIGLAKARTISWDNLTTQLGVNSDYSDARAGAIAAAIARYGACSNEVKQVTNAWFAVGVGNPYVDVEVASSSDVSCNGESDGSITISAVGTAPFTYSWSDGPNSQNRTGLSGGIYTVTVTDATGCTASISKTISEPDPLSITGFSKSNFNGFNISCNGASDGEATVNIDGGTLSYSYQWDADAGNQTTATATGLSAGTYCVVVTDANGCMVEDCVTLTEPPVLTAVISNESDYNGYNISCHGGNDGWATVTEGGGVAPFTYLWSDGQMTSTASDLSAGYYSVTVTDANGCTETTDITLTEPDPLTIDAGENQTVYYGYPPAECADISWSGEGGGVPPYTITWNDGGAQTHEVCPGEFTTIYTVTIEDANGCIETDEVKICVIDVRCGKKLDKVELCHIPPGNPNKAHTICVSVNAVATHLEHGDVLGACGIDHSCDDDAKSAPDLPISSFEAETTLNAYPNPFNTSTTVEFSSSVDGRITLELFDYTGKLIKVLYNSEAEAGSPYEVEVNASGLQQGLMFCILKHSDGTVKIQKLVLNN